DHDHPRGSAATQGLPGRAGVAGGGPAGLRRPGRLLRPPVRHDHRGERRGRRRGDRDGRRPAPRRQLQRDVPPGCRGRLRQLVDGRRLHGSQPERRLRLCLRPLLQHGRQRGDRPRLRLRL
ncbi:MAG: probable iron binding protein from the HesB_IscA_SufA family, partial [uncultured Thermomicrobiales bacterium]